MLITKTTQLNATLTLDTVAGGIQNYASFSGTVDESGVPTMSYYISDEAVYKANLKAFRSAWTDFQNAVFDEADSITTALGNSEV
ncbi:hypothetical protein [Weissella cibaria]|uniref:hypothetical protein n=1 Tax=Weissella cibaria TaxID=137591 RepID=UPI003D3668B1